MRKYILIILLFSSISGFAQFIAPQNIPVGGYDTTGGIIGRPGKIYVLKPTRVQSPLTLVNDSTIGITGSALTKTDDTNVTLTLGGTPTTALLQATSLTLGWTGLLPVARGGTGTATPGLVAGTNITSITGTWPNQTINASGGASGWNLTGNAGITPITNFLGTTDAQSLRINTNGIIRAYFDSVGKTFIDSTYFGRGGGGRLYNYGSIGIGDSALGRITTGIRNTIIGDSSGLSITTGSKNTSLGYHSLLTVSTTSENTAIGDNVMAFSTTGNLNTAIGSGAMSTGNGSANVAVGVQVLNLNTGSNNTAMGYAIMPNNTGSYNTGVGWNALITNTSGGFNAAFGLSLSGNTSGSNNTASGYAAGQSNTSGGNNSYIGYFSGQASTTGTYNNAFGSNALEKNVLGSNNIGIGYFSGKYILGGSGLNQWATRIDNSIFIGDSTRPLGNNQNNQKVFGNNVTGLGSNTMVLGDSLQTRTGVYGTLEFMMSGNGIKGTTTNDNATALNVGEEVNAIVSTYTNYTTTATYQNVTSITLTAGDWDLSAFYTYSSNSATITAAANAIFVISTTTASASGATEGKNISYVPQAALLGTSFFSDAIAPYRVSISGSTTYYLNSQAAFTLGNPQYVGSIRARRMR